MVGRIAMCSVGILVGLAGMGVQAQAPAESAPGNGAGCARSVPVCVPAKPCRPCLLGPGIKGLFGGWCRPCKCQQPVACPTCAPTPAPCQPVQAIRVRAIPQCQPKLACATCPTPVCGCPVCVARRTPVVAKVVVNCTPAPCCTVPPAYNMVPVPATVPQRATAVPTTATPRLAAPAVDPYAAFIESVQTTQEKDARAIQEMMEHRQANLAVIRSMQAADSNAVAAFEKLVRQMKEGSPQATPVPAIPAPPDAPVASPTTDTPPVVTLPIVPILPVTPIPSIVVPVPAALPAGPSPKEIQALMEELDRLSQKVKELNGQTQASPNN